MSGIDPRTPVVVGVGQVVQRVEDPAEAEEPLALMERAARLAAEDAGAPRLLAQLDALRVPKGLWNYANPGAWLAERLGAERPETWLAPISGTTVLSQLSGAAADVRDGKKDVVLLVGGEAEHSKRRAKARGDEPRRTLQEGPPPDHEPGPMTPGDWKRHPDVAAGLRNPTQCFGLFEVAMRYRRGESVAAHRARVAGLWARFARVAADNPYAWVRSAPDADAIIAPMDGNRVVSAPYTKYMVANMVVDQAAALLVCSAEAAMRAGVPRDRWVFPWVGTYAQNAGYLSDRDVFHAEPTLGLAARRALELAGVEADELGCIDLYSCFPAAVQLAVAELGLDEAGTPTVTGGLTFAGGPFNSYVMHSLATTVLRLREDGRRPAMVSGVGGFVARHAFGVLGATPRPEGFVSEDLSEAAAALPRRAYQADYTGPVTLETGVVPYANGAPERAIVAALTPDGARTWAGTRDPGLLGLLAEEELCGREARVGPERDLQL